VSGYSPAIDLPGETGTDALPGHAHRSRRVFEDCHTPCVPSQSVVHFELLTGTTATLGRAGGRFRAWNSSPPLALNKVPGWSS
jgi:hypothetical protein